MMDGEKEPDANSEPRTEEAEDSEDDREPEERSGRWRRRAIGAGVVLCLLLLLRIALGFVIPPVLVSFLESRGVRCSYAEANLTLRNGHILFRDVLLRDEEKPERLLKVETLAGNLDMGALLFGNVRVEHLRLDGGDLVLDEQGRRVLGKLIGGDGETNEEPSPASTEESGTGLVFDEIRIERFRVRYAVEEVDLTGRITLNIKNLRDPSAGRVPFSLTLDESDDFDRVDLEGFAALNAEHFHVVGRLHALNLRNDAREALGWAGVWLPQKPVTVRTEGSFFSHPRVEEKWLWRLSFEGLSVRGTDRTVRVSELQIENRSANDSNGGLSVQLEGVQGELVRTRDGFRLGPIGLLPGDEGDHEAESDERSDEKGGGLRQVLVRNAELDLRDRVFDPALTDRIVIEEGALERATKGYRLRIRMRADRMAERIAYDGRWETDHLSGELKADGLEPKLFERHLAEIGVEPRIEDGHLTLALSAVWEAERVEVELSNLLFSGRSGRLAALEKSSIALKWDDVGRILVERAEFHGPEVVFGRLEDGSIRVAGFALRSRLVEPRRRDFPGFVIRRLLLSGGRVDLEDDVVDRAFELEGLEGELTGLVLGPEPPKKEATFSLSSRAPGAVASLKLRGKGVLWNRGARGELKAEARGIRFPAFRPYLTRAGLEPTCESGAWKTETTLDLRFPAEGGARGSVGLRSALLEGDGRVLVRAGPWQVAGAIQPSDDGGFALEGLEADLSGLLVDVEGTPGKVAGFRLIDEGLEASANPRQPTTELTRIGIRTLSLSDWRVQIRGQDGETPLRIDWRAELHDLETGGQPGVLDIRGQMNEGRERIRLFGVVGKTPDGTRFRGRLQGWQLGGERLGVLAERYGIRPRLGGMGRLGAWMTVEFDASGRCSGQLRRLRLRADKAERFRVARLSWLVEGGTIQEIRAVRPDLAIRRMERDGLRFAGMTFTEARFAGSGKKPETRDRALPVESVIVRDARLLWMDDLVQPPVRRRIDWGGDATVLKPREGERERVAVRLRGESGDGLKGLKLRTVLQPADAGLSASGDLELAGLSPALLSPYFGKNVEFETPLAIRGGAEFAIHRLDARRLRGRLKATGWHVRTPTRNLFALNELEIAGELTPADNRWDLDTIRFDAEQLDLSEASGLPGGPGSNSGAEGQTDGATVPTVRVKEVDLRLRSLKFPEETGLDDMKELRLQGRSPFLLDGVRPSQSPGFDFVLNRGAGPVAEQATLTGRVVLFSRSPGLEGRLTMQGVDGSRIARWLGWGRARGKPGVLEADLDLRVRLRDGHLLSGGFRQPFGGELHLRNLILRDDPKTVRGRIDDLAVRVGEVHLKTRTLRIRSIDIEGPRAKLVRTAEGTRFLGLLFPNDSGLDKPESVDSAETKAEKSNVNVDWYLGRLRVGGLSLDIEDRREKQSFHLPIRSADLRAGPASGELLAGGETVPFEMAFQTGRVPLRPLRENGSERPERRPFLLEFKANGRVGIEPRLWGVVKTRAAGIEMGALNGLLAARGLRLRGLLDLEGNTEFARDGSVDSNTRLVFRNLDVESGEGDPVRKFLGLPTPTGVAIFLLRDERGVLKVPLDIELPPGEVSFWRYLDTVSSILARMVRDALANSPFRLFDSIEQLGRGAIGLDWVPWQKEEEARDVVGLRFAAGVASFRGKGMASLEEMLSTLRENPDLAITLHHVSGTADVRLGRRQRGPTVDDCRAYIDRLRRRRWLLEGRRNALLGEMQFASSAGLRRKAARVRATLADLEEELGRLEEALAELYQRLETLRETDAPTSGNRRLRNYLVALGNARLSAVEEYLDERLGDRSGGIYRFRPTGEGKQTEEKGAVWITVLRRGRE